jgi:hypothetical protein
LVSARGGSRYQIGGPAGAFIVLVASTVTKFGLESLDRERSIVHVKQSGSPKKVLATGRFWREADIHWFEFYKVRDFHPECCAALGES